MTPSNRSAQALPRAIRLGLALGSFLAFSPAFVIAQEVVTPPAALVMEGVPPVPANIPGQVAKYTEFRPTSFSGWHPSKVEMLISRRHKNTPQVFRVAKPGAEPELLTDYAEPVRGASWQPKTANYFLFTRDSGGNEVFRVYRKDVKGGEATPVTPENQRAGGLSWSKDGKQVIYTTVPVGRQGSGDKINTSVYLADPLKPDAARKLAELPGGGWGSFQFSNNGKQLVYEEYVSINESYLWLMDLASGKTRKLTDREGGEPVSYGVARFSPDDKSLYTTTDRGAEFRRLTRIDLATGKHFDLTPDLNWDVEGLTISDDGKKLAYVVNEDGTNVLRLMSLPAHKPLVTPKLPLGTLGGLSWHPNSTELGFSISSATSPWEAYSLNIKTGKITRWTTHEKMEVDPATFVQPELVRWKSFDGRTISGFLYRAPAAKFPGKRPVLVNIHGGPEGQSRPGFQVRNNYFLNEMGISLIYPNVRGSTGYGKTFLKLDNGKLREDSVKDIGALFDWIGTQGDLDASKVAVTGGSYGGYMSLAVSVLYSDRIAGSIDVVGISNFVTFLERTESYRRDLRRVEYGDERDPEMRKWMEETAPVNRADRIKKPLFVVQGKNDPRVPWQEADQIVKTVKKNGGTVWYMLANDEGHGFNKKANADYQFYSTITFLKQTLLDGK